MSYPQGDLHLEGAARTRVLQRETLVKSHVLSLQQAAQRQRQRPQRTFVLRILHLKLSQSFLSQPVKNNLEQLLKNRQDPSVPRPPAFGFGGCELRKYELPPRLVHWFYIWSERVKGKNRNNTVRSRHVGCHRMHQTENYKLYLVLTKSPKLLHYLKLRVGRLDSIVEGQNVA